MMKLLFGAAAGFAAAWFLDPNDGARRRSVLQDKAGKYVRKGKREAVRKADYAAGQAKGVASSVTPDTTKGPAEERLNDPALARKVESEIFRDADAPKGDVSVSAEYGVIYLRGQLDDREQIDAIVAKARGVDGVRAVENLLHLPSETAPTQ